MVKRGLVISIIVFVILIIVGILYVQNLFSEVAEEERKNNLIRSSNPPVPENARPVGSPAGLPTPGDS